MVARWVERQAGWCECGSQVRKGLGAVVLARASDRDYCEVGVLANHLYSYLPSYFDLFYNPRMRAV